MDGGGVEQSVVSHSLANPLLDSIVIWNEQPVLVRVIRFSQALIAILLLVQGRGSVGSDRSIWTSFILSGCFTSIGIVGVTMDCFARILAVGKSVFLTCMFVPVAVGTQVSVLSTKPSSPRLYDFTLAQHWDWQT